MNVPFIKILINRFYLLKILALLADDLRWGLNLKRGKIDTDSGAIHSTFSEEKSLRYIEEVFQDYKHYGNITNFYGKIAEIGPGDNAGIALLLRADGCEKVDLIDRFYSHRDPNQQNKIYESLSKIYPIGQYRIGEGWNDQNLSGVKWKTGQAAEEYFKSFAQEFGDGYDFILSRAVLEHLYNPLKALSDMVGCLKPGGKMLHKIDLRDHGMFTPMHHELTFLNIPGSIYRLMTRNSGRPNRILVHRYREILKQLKYINKIDYSILVTGLSGLGEVSPHQKVENINVEDKQRAENYVKTQRRYLAKEFQEVSNLDLSINGIFLIIEKQLS